MLEDFDRGNKLRQSFIMKRKTAASDPNQYIEVKMNTKFIVDQETKKPIYEFTVTLLRDFHKEYKVAKTYQDFVTLDAHVVDVINYLSTS